MDSIAPTLDVAEVYSTSDSQSTYYKQLADKAFGSWTTAERDGYAYGDYSQNHVGGSVYLKLYGSDVGNGVDKILVTETYYRSTDGYTTSNSGQDFLIDCTKENGIFSATYNLRSVNDGIIKLELALCDYSGLKSNTKTFFVLKDTMVDISNVVFQETWTAIKDRKRPDYFRQVLNNQKDEVKLSLYFFKSNNSSLLHR